jgi:hypothetical protein
MPTAQISGMSKTWQHCGIPDTAHRGLLEGNQRLVGRRVQNSPLRFSRTSEKMQVRRGKRARTIRDPILYGPNTVQDRVGCGLRSSPSACPLAMSPGMSHAILVTSSMIGRVGRSLIVAGHSMMVPFLPPFFRRAPSKLARMYRKLTGMRGHALLRARQTTSITSYRTASITIDWVPPTSIRPWLRPPHRLAADIDERTVVAQFGQPTSVSAFNRRRVLGSRCSRAACCWSVLGPCARWPVHRPIVSERSMCKGTPRPKRS